MADYGMIFSNQDGRVLIDGVHRNYVFYEGSSYTTPSATLEAVYEISLTAAQDDPPIIALRTDGATSNIRVGVKSMVLNGSDQYTGFNLYYYKNNPGTDKVYWRAYRPMQTGDLISSNYGINLYDPDGDPVWSSDAQVMEIVGAYGPLDMERAYGEYLSVYDTDNYFICNPFIYIADPPLTTGSVYNHYILTTDPPVLCVRGSVFTGQDIMVAEVTHRT